MAVLREYYDNLFEQFWLAGMRKVDKKRAKQKYMQLIKGEREVKLFTAMIIKDVQDRIKLKQFGFQSMHPTTYLNNERWDDELPKEAQNDTVSRPESAIECAQRQAREVLTNVPTGSDNFNSMGSHDSDLPCQMDEPRRGLDRTRGRTGFEYQEGGLFPAGNVMDAQD